MRGIINALFYSPLPTLSSKRGLKPTAFSLLLNYNPSGTDFRRRPYRRV